MVVWSQPTYFNMQFTHSETFHWNFWNIWDAVVLILEEFPNYSQDDGF